MIDLKALREDPKPYQDSARRRGISAPIDKILELDAKRLELIRQVEDLRSRLNVKGKPSAEELEALQEAKAELAKAEPELNEAESQLNDLLQEVPNLIADDTPDGGEEANREEKTWGKADKRTIKDHLALGEEQGWIDFERGAKVAGSKFYYLKGPVVRLEQAVMRLAMDKLEAAGFTLMATPHLVNTRTLEGTGFAPRGDEEQVYRLSGDDLALIGTAEIPLTGYHADEILDKDSLPLCYAALTPSYRKEAGAYGKHSKGLFRVHQFNKLEMYVFCKPEDSAEWHNKLLAIEEELCQALEIPYRVVRIAAGDLGAPAYQKYDIEYWSPVDGQYRELASCSNCTDYQARRLNIRTRGEGGKLPVHTLNGTAIAYSRVLIAILENHQQPDGGIKLPQALHDYYGGTTL